MSLRILAAAALVIFAMPAGAQEAAPVAATGAGTWPRVFFTPEERRRVTQQRQAALEGNRQVAAGPIASESAATADTVRRRVPRVDGISLVRGARFAAWIGGRRVEDGGRWDGYRLRVTREGVELVDAAGTARLVKVGQPVVQPAQPPGRIAP